MEIPYSLVESVAAVLSLDEKGWMNKLTKLENASTIEQFVTEMERMISRGVYAAKAQRKDLRVFSNIRKEDLEKISELQEPRSFRAFKALFLLAVMGKIRMERGEGGE